ncbi:MULTISPECIES: ectoine/hydroxyectoine ABC transporter substrate-binding protein EhuB [Streptomyces]|uniref:ectoine/hydroxyectoine ABC transporter substrate-binding protein EhuB n=1 Tax=Streptomyces TaxID=1883 RepID=UPI0001D067BD|nr:ectoine/hydroxyectoine ABC transporter substrate-binding protein EhuB [Streptomyces sennicomposti]EFF91203.1 ectoine/hydroxyectoine ABC transporter solute-binding protein [Streptomyces sp. e14]MBY8867216.1 ectoine/hydroxyectoine ABC transporter substrate-binding protein EhuB [Streptomyces sennicomposti]MYX45568.1 ectoine/hydroxyectoine ABC transporter substrate-binding protein EhuB [Streptomyces sp. SID89]NED33884.1 ectoine/hydroxyectoine ABC transporter substrate-binding protein EhuB [Strep
MAALGAVGALGAAGCSRVATASAENGGDLLDRLRAQGVVRLGIAGEIPFGYIDRDGELTGEAPELARVVFERLGVAKVQPVPTEFGSLIPGLNSQQFDVVAAGMYVNAERCAQVIFADPDYQMLDSFVVRKGNPKGLHDYRDVVAKKAKFATGTGYAQIQHAVAAGYEESDILIVPDQVAGLNAVEAGRADVFAGTALTTREVVKKSAKAEATEAFAPLVDGKPQVDGGAFAFRPTETKLRDAFNTELHKLKKSGELFRILRPFGFTKDEMTDLTAKELCAG